MNKHDVIKAIAAEANLSMADAMMAYQALTGIIKERIASGEEVQIDGFGTFEVRRWLAREGCNPRTGGRIHIGDRRRPFFRPGYELIRD